MSTPIDENDKPPEPSSPEKRDVRDTRWFRVVALLAVLAAAFLATKSCAARDEKVDQDEAIEIAREQVSFTPDDVQVRYVQRGIPPEGFWAVSLYTVGKDGKPDRVRVILVNETTGDPSDAAPRPAPASPGGKATV